MIPSARNAFNDRYQPGKYSELLRRLEERCGVPIEQLKASYNRFLAESDPARKNEAGKDLIRAIFGKDAIAEDSVR